MGGSIWVESKPGLGSTFFFTARFGIAEILSDATGRNHAVVIGDMPALIVDDNATNRRILFDMLSNWSMRPTLATGAREAFKQLHDAALDNHPFQIVLLDVNMPEVNGFELASWIRDDCVLADTPLVMLTSASRPGDVEHTAALRIAATLLKPVKQSELYDTIVSVISATSVEEEAVQHAAAGQVPRFDSLRVLLAEDNAVNQKLAVGVLTKLGCSVTVAENGRRAVAELERNDFGVVLMDVQMPEMDGFEATQAIRQHERSSGRHTPIIAMTAHAMRGDRERCVAAGMDDYLSKPVRIRELSDKLALVLGGAIASNGAATPPPAGDCPIDWADALEAAGDDRELLQTVIDAFFEESATLMQQIRASIRLNDAASLQKSAHTLKGALLAVGARRTSTLAFDLERQGMSGNLMNGDVGLEALERQIAILLPFLKNGAPAATIKLHIRA
jgi:CheY-like chemotaxis protein